MHDACGSRLAYLSSLREISVVDTQGSVDECLQRIPVSVEPSFVALGPQHVAVGMNIRIWLYRYGDRKQQQAQLRQAPLAEPEREFPGNIEAIRLNKKYVAVLCEGRVHLQLIEPRAGTQEQDTKIFSAQVQQGGGGRDSSGRITCLALTDSMLIYGLSGAAGGGLKFFSLDDWVPLDGIDYRHGSAPTQIVPSPSGTPPAPKTRDTHASEATPEAAAVAVAAAVAGGSPGRSSSPTAAGGGSPGRLTPSAVASLTALDEWGLPTGASCHCELRGEARVGVALTIVCWARLALDVIIDAKAGGGTIGEGGALQPPADGAAAAEEGASSAASAVAADPRQPGDLLLEADGVPYSM